MSVFHSPQPAHWPLHLGWWVPHSLQTCDVFILLTPTVWPTGVTMVILSRQTAGTCGGASSINLPGQPKAIVECLDALMAAVLY